MAFNDPKASYVLRVYWRNSTKVNSFYSRDFAYKGAKERKPELGLARLVKYVTKNLPSIKTALIYNTGTDQLVKKYSDGYEVSTNTTIEQ